MAEDFRLTHDFVDIWIPRIGKSGTVVSVVLARYPEGLNRAELRSKTGLTPPTVSAALVTLIREGLVKPPSWSGGKFKLNTEVV